MQAQQQDLEEARNRREAELKLRLALQQLLSPGALSRLNNIRLSNEELYQQIVQFVVMLYQQGRLQGKVSEEQIKAFAAKLLEQRKETKITFLRK